jgi:hypothetical protein
MNAYLYAMLMIFANAGVFMVAKLGVFGSRMSGFDFFTAATTGTEADPIIPAIYWAGGTILLAGLLAAGTIKVLGTNLTATTAQGMTYVVFSLIFWASFLAAFSIMLAIPLDAMRLILVPVFLGINIFVFIMALFQMVTGGFKAHD